MLSKCEGRELPFSWSRYLSAQRHGDLGHQDMSVSAGVNNAAAWDIPGEESSRAISAAVCAAAGALAVHFRRAAFHPLCSQGGVKSCHFTPAWWLLCPS